MVSKSDSGSVGEFQGKPVTPEIPYSFTWQEFENVTEAKNSDAWPNDSDNLKTCNETAKRAAKAKAYVTAIADLKKKYENSQEFKDEQLVKAVMASKNCDRATAEAFIAALS